MFITNPGYNENGFVTCLHRIFYDESQPTKGAHDERIVNPIEERGFVVHDLREKRRGYEKVFLSLLRIHLRGRRFVLFRFIFAGIEQHEIERLNRRPCLFLDVFFFCFLLLRRAIISLPDQKKFEHLEWCSQ